eukprot:gene3997-4966_t
MRAHPDIYFLLWVPLALAFFSTGLSVLLLVYVFLGVGACALRVTIQGKAQWKYGLLLPILATSLVPWCLPSIVSPIWPSPGLLPMWLRGVLIPLAAASSLVFLLSFFARLVAWEEEELLLKGLAAGKKPTVPKEHRFSIFKGPQVRPRTQPKTRPLGGVSGVQTNNENEASEGYLHYLMKLRVPQQTLIVLILFQMVLCGCMGHWMRTTDLYNADLDGQPQLQALQEERLLRSELRLQELEESLTDRISSLKSEAASKVQQSAGDLQLRINQLEKSLRIAASASTDSSDVQSRIKQLEHAMKGYPQDWQVGFMPGRHHVSLQGAHLTAPIPPARVLARLM